MYGYITSRLQAHRLIVKSTTGQQLHAITRADITQMGSRTQAHACTLMCKFMEDLRLYEGIRKELRADYIIALSTVRTRCLASDAHWQLLLFLHICKLFLPKCQVRLGKATRGGQGNCNFFRVMQAAESASICALHTHLHLPRCRRGLTTR